VNNWVLGIELNGEWEHCRFQTRQEALASFAALANDYPVKIARAVLFWQPVAEQEKSTTAAESKYLN
jgi:hypothetical protein